MYNNIFRAVVEDNKDPLGIGRVKIRVQGVHSAKLKEVATADLPWSEVSAPIGTGAGTGSITSMIIGAWVFCVPLNEAYSDFLIIGAINGSIDASPSVDTDGDALGFRDPNDTIPTVPEEPPKELSTLSITSLLTLATATQNNHGYSNGQLIKIFGANESSYNGDFIILVTSPDNFNYNMVSSEDSPATGNIFSTSDTSHEPTGVGNVPVVPISDRVVISNPPDVDFIESPDTSAKAEYPNNHVYQDPNGNYFEIDGTPGNSRIRIQHSSGARVEISVDGDITIQASATGNVWQETPGLFSIGADGNMIIEADVKIVGSLEVTTDITAGGNVTAVGEVADGQGNMTSLRTAYDTHTHIYDHPQHVSGPANTVTPTTTDPLTREVDFTWVGTPK